MRKKRIITIILIGALAFIILGIVGLELLARTYQEKAGVYFRDQFTKKSDLVLQPFKTSISVWRHFPRITINFQNLSLIDTIGSTPVQVLFVKQAGISIPLGQLNFTRIKISRLDLEDVIYYERVDSTGKRMGVHFRKNLKSPADTAASNLAFIIPKITLRNGHIKSENFFKQSAYSFRITGANLAANFKDQKLNLNGPINGKIEYFKNIRYTLFQNEPFKLNLLYTYFPNQKKGIFTNTEALLNKDKIKINGWHKRLADNTGNELNMKLTGYQPLIYLFQQLLPVQAQSFLSKVKSDSRLYFEYYMTEKSGAMLSPRNKIAFRLHNGKFYLPANQRYIQDVNLTGYMDNGAQHTSQTSQFQITNLTANTDQGRFGVKLQVTDFVKPNFSIQGSGQIDLLDLNGLVNLPFTSLSQGSIKGDFNFTGSLPDTLQGSKPDWRGQGSVQLQKAIFKPVGLTVNCTNVNGILQFSGNLLHLQNLSGNIGGQPFRLQASVRNYMAYLFQHPGAISANASVYASKLDTDWLDTQPSENKTNVSRSRQTATRKSTRSPFLFVQNKAETSRSSRKTKSAAAVDYVRQNWWYDTRMQVNLRVAHVNLPSTEKIKNLSVQVNQINNQVKLTHMRFATTGNGQATANGGFLLNKQGINAPYLNVRLQYPDLDMQKFMQSLASLKEASLPASTTNKNIRTKPKSTFLKKQNYRVNLQVGAKKIQYQYLRGTDLELFANLNPQRVKVTQLRLQAFNGNIQARGEMRLNEPRNVLPVKLRTRVDNISLPQLFSIADNMKLDVLGSQNIRGTVACNLTVYTELDNTFAPSFDGTVAYAKATFNNLELIEVTPIQTALHLLREDRTRHLYFKDVTTHFILQQNQFITPGLNLYSNLAAFDLNGTYTMGGPAKLNMDINVLSVLLGNNKRRIEKIQNDTTSVQSQGRKQHLILMRENDKYKVKLSNRKNQEANTESLKKEFYNLIQQHQIDTVFAKKN